MTTRAPARPDWFRPVLAAALLAVVVCPGGSAAGGKAKKPPGVGAPAGGMLMPDLGKVLGPGWTVPPELSDRALPGAVLEVSVAGYKRVMAGCVAAQPTQNSVTDVSLSSSLAGGVGWGGGPLGGTATASEVLRLQFNSPTIYAYDLVEFAPTRECVLKLQGLAARGGVEPSRWVVVQEALMARVSGCEQRSISASASAFGGGAGAAAAGVCEMMSDAPVVVGLKAVAVRDIPELAELAAQQGARASRSGSTVPVSATPDDATARLPAVGAAPRASTAASAPPPPDGRGSGVSLQAASSATRSSGVVAPTSPSTQRGAGGLAGVPARASTALAPGDRVLGRSGYPLRLVPAGTYALGCTEGQRGACAEDEVGPAKVTLGRAILVGETEVTQELYMQWMGENPSRHVECGPRCPVEQVTWLDAVHLANRLSVAEGFGPCYIIDGEAVAWPEGVECLGYRLPTEVEWEVAARGGRDHRFAGGADASLVGWHRGNSGGQTHPVGLKQANGYGLFDMSGNVLEWVWDWYDSDGFSVVGAVVDSGDATAADVSAPTPRARRVGRGGSWFNDPEDARVANRDFADPDSRSGSLGLRLVRSAP